MPVDVTPVKNRPSKRASRAVTAREQISKSSGCSMSGKMGLRPRDVSRFSDMDQAAALSGKSKKVANRSAWARSPFRVSSPSASSAANGAPP